MCKSKFNHTPSEPEIARQHLKQSNKINCNSINDSDIRLIQHICYQPLTAGTNCTSDRVFHFLARDRCVSMTQGLISG